MAKGDLNALLRQYGSLLGVLLVLVGIGFGANWVYQQYYPDAPTLSIFADPNEYINELNASVSAQTIPQGLAQELENSRIYLMLANKGSAHAQPHAFVNGRITPIPENGVEDWYYSMSPDGSLMTFFAASSDGISSRDAWDTLARLYVTDAPKAGGPAFPQTLSPSDMIDDGNVLSRQLPSVSDNGDVLFMGTAEDDGAAWGVFLADGDDTRMLAHGFMPQWIDTETFAFIKEDGIYAYSLANDQDQRIIEASGTLTYPENRISVSRDGNILAWTDSKNGTIRVFAFDAAYATEEIGVIPATATWVAISPSNSYLAASLTREHPSISFFDLSTFAPVTGSSLSLDKFEHSFTFLTDWAPLLLAD